MHTHVYHHNGCKMIRPHLFLSCHLTNASKTRGKVLSWEYRSLRKRNSRPPAFVHIGKNPRFTAFLDSNLHTRLAIVTKNELGLAFPPRNLPKKFRPDPSTSYLVIVVTDKQRDRQTNAGDYIIPRTSFRRDNNQCVHWLHILANAAINMVMCGTSNSFATMLNSGFNFQHVTCYCTKHPFNGPLSGTSRVGQYQKGKTNLNFTGEWQWHQLGHMQVCTSLQTDNHASTPTNSVKAPKANQTNHDSKMHSFWARGMGQTYRSQHRLMPHSTGGHNSKASQLPISIRCAAATSATTKSTAATTTTTIATATVSAPTTTTESSTHSYKHNIHHSINNSSFLYCIHYKRTKGISRSLNVVVSAIWCSKRVVANWFHIHSADTENARSQTFSFGLWWSCHELTCGVQTGRCTSVDGDHCLVNQQIKSVLDPGSGWKLVQFLQSRGHMTALVLNSCRRSSAAPCWVLWGAMPYTATMWLPWVYVFFALPIPGHYVQRCKHDVKYKTVKYVNISPRCQMRTETEPCSYVTHKAFGEDWNSDRHAHHNTSLPPPE